MFNKTLIVLAVSASLLPLLGTAQSQQRRERPRSSAPDAQAPNAARASQPVASSSTAPEILTNASIVETVQLGFGEALIIEKIKQSKHDFNTSLAGLRALKQAQVSDAVIAAMMGGAPTTPAPKPAAAPVTTLTAAKSAPTAHARAKLVR